jgi:hypothetical protein
MVLRSRALYQELDRVTTRRRNRRSASALPGPRVSSHRTRWWLSRLRSMRLCCHPHRWPGCCLSTGHTSPERLREHQGCPAGRLCGVRKVWWLWRWLSPAGLAGSWRPGSHKPATGAQMPGLLELLHDAGQAVVMVGSVSPAVSRGRSKVGSGGGQVIHGVNCDGDEHLRAAEGEYLGAQARRAAAPARRGQSQRTPLWPTDSSLHHSARIGRGAYHLSAAATAKAK